MKNDQPNILDLFANPNQAQQALINFIEKKIANGLTQELIERAVQDNYEYEATRFFCYAYTAWRFQDEEVQNSRRTQEDILEFGEEDDGSDCDDIDEELRKALDDLLGEDDEAYAQIGDFKLYCTTDHSQLEFSVSGLCQRIQADENKYIHIDIELPQGRKVEHLVLAVSTAKTSRVLRFEYTAQLIKERIKDNRLRLAPFLLSEVVESHYTLDDREKDFLQIAVYENSEKVGDHQITIDGPFRKDDMTYDTIPPVYESEDVNDRIEVISGFVGWDSLQDHLSRLLEHWLTEMHRAEMGLEHLPPKLHTIIMGNPGTGKSLCIPYLAGMYYAFSYLKTERIIRTSVTRLTIGGNNSGYTKTMEMIEKAQGGVLVLENAHELYKSEPRLVEEESRIICALVDAMENKANFPCWALILVGETEGMQQLLASKPQLRKHFAKPIIMEDFKPEHLCKIANDYCEGHQLVLSQRAQQKLEMYIRHKYNHRGPDFQNGRAVEQLFEEQIIPNMDERLEATVPITKQDLLQILPADIPSVASKIDIAVDELDSLVGLEKLKTKIKDYLYAVQLAGKRMNNGLPANMPRLHMAFLGNPGTGKTTVAEIIGKIFASWGILSEGHVIRTEKSQMVGQYIGETEQKMINLLSRARGNILFIDEAYQLVEGGEKDYGHIVMNSLLTELGKEYQDMVVILAGYTAPMKKLLESNEGIESRFPNVFNFEDFTVDELVAIGKRMIQKQGFVLTQGAEANLRQIIAEESDRPSPRFGNGRFVANLLQNEILASMGARIAKIDKPTKADLCNILPEDVVVGKAYKDVVFDDLAINAALARLDALAGLEGVKKAVHNFVQTTRYLQAIGEPYVGKGLLSWRFIGKSGTGKSTVAEIMACILKGMRLIANSHITEIKGERIFNVSETDCDEVLRDAVKRSCNGLLFIDVDDKIFRNPQLNYGRSVEQIRLKIKELTIEAGGECALVVAELDAPNKNVAEQLADAGIHEFDHTLLFKDFTTAELYQILCDCLKKYNVSFTPEAEKHIQDYLKAVHSSVEVNARTMKLMSRTIYQQVLLRESSSAPLPPPLPHQVRLSDIQNLKWDKSKGKIGF